MKKDLSLGSLADYRGSSISTVASAQIARGQKLFDDAAMTGRLTTPGLRSW